MLRINKLISEFIPRNGKLDTRIINFLSPMNIWNTKQPYLSNFGVWKINIMRFNGPYWKSRILQNVLIVVWRSMLSRKGKGDQFPYPMVFESTGPKDWLLKGRYERRYIPRSLLNKVTNLGQNEGQKLPAFHDLKSVGQRRECRLL